MFLPRGSEVGTLVWSGDMGAHRDNDSVVRGSACEFLRQVTSKQATRRRDGS